MKNLTKLWSLALLLTASMFMVSCEKDEPTIDVDEDGVAVSDGYYFTLDEADPVADKALLPEKVEGAEFAATDREGFFGNYVFLQAGDYQLKKVQEREIVSTIGGTLGQPEGDEGYMIAEATEGGGAITVAENGYYKVSYDEQLSELIMMKVTNVSLIGSATPNGWGGDTELAVTQEASDEGFVFSGSDIVMRAGEFKIRINNRWAIDRRIDKELGATEPNNGYVAFTNYGGSTETLVPGGSNIAFASADEGTYDVTITLSNEVGAAFESTRTGDAPEITFVPEENNWAVVGAATNLGWPANNDCGAAGQDVDMTYDGQIGGAYTWSVEIDLAADQFKFRTNDCWDNNLNYTQVEVGGPDAANITNAGGNDNNFLNNVAGRYNIVLSTANAGESYSISFELLEATGTDPLDPTTNQWAVVGAATELGWPAGDCGVEGEDVDMTYDGVVNGAHTWSVTLPLTADEFKWRKNDCWADGELNFSNTTMTGPNADNFSNPENGNVKCDVAGTYAIVLTTSDEGVSYTAEFTLQ